MNQSDFETEKKFYYVLDIYLQVTNSELSNLITQR